MCQHRCPVLSLVGAAMHRLPIAIDSRTTSDLHPDLHFTLQKVCSCCHWDFHENAVYECSPLRGLTEFVNRKGFFSVSCLKVLCQR